MNGLRVITIVVGLCVAFAAHAQTQVPNVFQAGEPARAADVNENFSALGEAANDNAANIANNASSIAVNASSIDGNADAIAAANSNVSQNVAAIQANLDSIAQVQETIVDRRPSLVDSNGVEVGRISQIDGSNTFTIEANCRGQIVQFVNLNKIAAKDLLLNIQWAGPHTVLGNENNSA